MLILIILVIMTINVCTNIYEWNVFRYLQSNSFKSCRKCTRIYQGNSSINSQTKRIRWVIIKQFDDHNSYTFIFATILILWTRDKQRTISEQRTDGTQQNNFCVRRSSSVGHVDTSNVVIFTVLT